MQFTTITLAALAACTVSAEFGNIVPRLEINPSRVRRHVINVRSNTTTEEGCPCGTGTPMPTSTGEVPVQGGAGRVATGSLVTVAGVGVAFALFM